MTKEEAARKYAKDNQGYFDSDGVPVDEVFLAGCAFMDEEVKGLQHELKMANACNSTLDERVRRLEEALGKIAKVELADDWGETTRWCRTIAREALAPKAAGEQE